MTETPGFFAAFFSLCRGTADAPRLVRNPFWKVFLQFLLLCVIVSVLVAIGQYTRMQRWIEDSESSFTGAFGQEIVLRGNGVYPQHDETRARSIVLPYKGRLCYTGADQSEAVVNDLGGLRYLILWRNGKFFCAVRSGEDQWGIFRPGEKRMVTNISGDRAALKILFEESELQPEKVFPENRKIAVADLAGIIRVVCWLLAFLQQFFDALFLGIIATGSAALIFSINSNRILRGIDLWKSALYAGFPAMVIAGCFPLFDLPVFSYPQIYLFATFIYWIWIVRRIESTWQQENNPDHSGGFYDN
ncbi:MAG: DUF1189 domain-containing protein [Victivallaceae bacterium]|nr:DUF1189 domain-containing protein [Victivallaceae bacterium]